MTRKRDDNGNCHDNRKDVEMVDCHNLTSQVAHVGGGGIQTESVT